MSTPDIFLSYNREDAARAKQFADGFAAEGLDVWWDVALRSGEAYDEVTENALRNAKAVVVLWSQKSVVSRWVRAEATLAERKKTLMPAMIEACERPIMFELVQTADLSHWTGNPYDPAWKSFAAHVREFIGREPEVAGPATNQPLPSLDQVSVVVLPFQNMSGDPEQDYFADGMAEDVITDLSKVSALKVIARATAFALKGQSIDVGEIARRLNVTHVVEGSVRKAGNRVRISAQLIDGSDNAHIWAERWDRDLTDIFELQDELSREIVKALKLNLLPSEKKELSARGTENVEAYDLAIRARAQHLTFGRPNSQQAVDLFRKAVELDPQFADAWFGLTEALGNLRMYWPERDEALSAEMKEAHRRGMAAQPNSERGALLEAELAGWEYDWDRMAKALARSSEDFFFGGHYFAELGQARRGVEMQLRLRDNDPLSIGTSFVTQYLLDAAGRLEEAEAEYQRSRGLVGPRVTMEWRAVTRAMVRGDRDRVRMIYADRWESDTHFQYYHPELLKVFDQPELALDVLRKALVNVEQQDGARMAALANWAIFYGDNDMAIDAIRRGLVERKHGIALLDLWMPNLAGIRRDPRFKDIVRELGFADYWRKSGNWGDFARPLGDDDFEIIG